MSFQNAKIVSENTPIEAYLAQPEGVRPGDPRFVMRSGELRAFFDCPQDWRLTGEVPEDGEEEDQEKITRAKLWGSLVDTLVTMPHELEKRYVVCPRTYTNSKGDESPWNLQSKYCKQWEADARTEGTEPVKAAFFAEAQAAALRLRNDPHVAELIKGAKFQVMVTADFVEDGVTVPFKVLLDIVPPIEGKYGDTLANLKTARKVDHDSWNRAVKEHGYDMQGALEFDIYNAAKPEENRTNYVRPIQLSKPPYTIGRRRSGPDGTMYLGREKYLRALRHYIQCLKKNEWPGLDDLIPSQPWTDEVITPWDMQRL